MTVVMLCMYDPTFIAVNRTGPDDLVLEDTIEETETVVGHGPANIFRAPNERRVTADTSETIKANKKACKQKVLGDRGVSLIAGNINANFKETEVDFFRSFYYLYVIVCSQTCLCQGPQNTMIITGTSLLLQ